MKPCHIRATPGRQRGQQRQLTATVPRQLASTTPLISRSVRSRSSKPVVRPPRFPPEDLEALEETLEIMRDAATMNRLAESDAELARGEYVSAEELAEAMRRRRAQ
jgi:hypothetical protein